MFIDHIGYAVKRIPKAMSEFEIMGFSFEQPIKDSDRNIMIVFGEKEGYRIELVSPLEKKIPSPVDQYLFNSPGTPYHICYRSEAFETEVENLEKQGFKVVISPKPAVAFGGKRVVFMMSLGMGLLEIVES